MRVAEKVILPAEKTILINEGCADIPLVTAQAVAHLDLGHDKVDGWLTDEQQDAAMWLGKMRVDGEDEVWRQMTVDGEPSVPLDGVATVRL